MTLRRKISILLNLMIVLFELFGFFITYQVKNIFITYEYYTDLSNLLLLIVCAIFLVYLVLGKKVPRWLEILKYSSTICLTLTFLVVVFILCPMNGFNYGFMLFYKSLLFQHFLCPILSVLTFLCFDEIKITTAKENFYGILLTVIYGIVIMFLNILRYVEGPYPFLLVYEQPVWQSVGWIIILLSLTYFIGFIIRKLQIIINRRVFYDAN